MSWKEGGYPKFDCDDEEDDPIDEPVLFGRVYKGFREGDSYDSYDPADLSKMKRDRIEQLRSRAYGAALTPEEKADFWNVHNWWQSLGEDEKQAEKNSQDTQREISKRSKKS